MTSELMALTVAALLQCVQYVLMAIPANLELGTRKTLSARDSEVMGGSIESQLSRKAARLVRALNNHFEGLILFTIAIFVVTLSGSETALTAVCAWIYVAARVLYVPAYAYAWVPWRSILWFAGFLSTIAILLASLFLQA
ncbi:MAG: MAPEG family protein [Granulosicoccus sp.]